MAKLFDLSSLRGKITSAYVALVVGTTVLGIIAISDLLFLEQQLTEGVVVSDLKDSVLEMRREEKNLFLYDDANALQRVQRHTKLALSILASNLTTLQGTLDDTAVILFSEKLKSYRSDLDQWQTIDESLKHALQIKIRKLGHQINLLAENFSANERLNLELAIRKSKWLLLITISLIGLSIYIVGRMLRRAAVKPLRELEYKLGQISAGQFDHLEPPSQDREFITFTEVFNRMLKELEVRQHRMLQSEKLASLGTLAAGVAHELNNPLSNISTSCQLLIEELREADPEQLNLWLKQIDNETQRGRNIVRTLLDFGSQQAFSKQRIKLLDIIQDTRIIIDKALHQKSAALHIDVPDEIYLQVDKQRMQQLFINLVQNALNAGDRCISIDIYAKRCDRRDSIIPEGAGVAGNLKCVTEHAGDFIKIVVADNGPGISKQSLQKVFDPFFTTSEPGHGVGLGLFIVQEIVGEHNGCLAISSDKINGTQVILLFPNEGTEDA